MFSWIVSKIPESYAIDVAWQTTNRLTVQNVVRETGKKNREETGRLTINSACPGDAFESIQEGAEGVGNIEIKNEESENEKKIVILGSKVNENNNNK